MRQRADLGRRAARPAAPGADPRHRSPRRPDGPRRLLLAGAAALVAGVLGVVPAAATDPAAAAAAPVAATAASASAGTRSAAVPAAASATATRMPTASPTAEDPDQDAAVHASVSVADGGVVASGAPAEVTVEVTAPAHTPVAGGSIEILVGDGSFSSRERLAEWRGGDLDPSLRTVATATYDSLAAGRTTRVPITVPGDALGLATTGTEVHPLEARVTPDDGRRSTALGTLIEVGGASTAKVQLTVVAPITVPADAATASGLVPADRLAGWTATTGLLTRELDAVAGHPDVALAVDPMIIASIRALGTSAPDSARAWLRRLASAGNETFPLRFGDADPAAQAQSGLTTLLAPGSLAFGERASDFTGDLSPLESPAPSPTAPGQGIGSTGTAAGTPTPTSAPGADVPDTQQLTSWPWSYSDIAWPAAGTVRRADLPVFAASGLGTTVVSSSDLGTSRTRLVAGHAVASDSDLLVADASLARAFDDLSSIGDDASGDADYEHALAVAQADLAVSASSEPGTTVLAVAPRGAPTSWLRMSEAYSSLASAPWADAASLSALRATTAEKADLDDHPEADSRLDSVRALLADEQAVARFSSVVTEPDELAGQTRARLLSLLGVGWLSPTYDWSGAVARSRETSASITSSVTVASTSSVTLVAASGSIPVTVTNDLADYTVDVELRASPSNARLEIEPSTAKTIQPSSSARVLVPVTARLGNGRVRLALGLYSTTGVEVSPIVTIPVTVRADWEGIATSIIGSLLVIVLAFGVVRTVRRRRRTTHGTEGDGPGGESEPHGDGHPGGDDPGGADGPPAPPGGAGGSDEHPGDAADQDADRAARGGARG